ncbi:hypothetical protein CEY00_Acc18622 [Actinidia chinensis var. chinensis]|uniref:Endoplasmic reticulum transmembrane protein n=1 Tax=Actinidia chinensis var. chinensis TaxID=1590841 RepID=A0A2R6QI38_ACTCC|nr:hypothetical protein CEY00_Acc18622 [Actinidia chinensis var. chinensis]
MALQWMILTYVVAVEAAIAVLLTIPSPKLVKSRLVSLISLILQPSMFIVPFAGFQLLDIYWKNEHRLMCTGETCTAAERDRYEKSNMELNRAQQLVHDDAALARFRRDHEILHDMLIEQTCPNESNVEGGDGSLWPHLHASFNELCKDRACRRYFNATEGASVLFFRPTERLHHNSAEAGAGTNLFTGNHYLLLRNSQQQPWSRLLIENPEKDLYLDEFVSVLGNCFNSHYKVCSEQCKANSNCEPRDITTLLRYEPIYHHTIPHRDDRLSQLALPPRQIREPADLAQRAQSSSSGDQSITALVEEQEDEDKKEEEGDEEEEEEE